MTFANYFCDFCKLFLWFFKKHCSLKYIFYYCKLLLIYANYFCHFSKTVAHKNIFVMFANNFFVIFLKNVAYKNILWFFFFKNFAHKNIFWFLQIIFLWFSNNVALKNICANYFCDISKNVSHKNIFVIFAN